MNLWERVNCSNINGLAVYFAYVQSDCDTPRQVCIFFITNEKYDRILTRSVITFILLTMDVNEGQYCYTIKAIL